MTFHTDTTETAAQSATAIVCDLAEEFSSIHVVNLRGNARTSGERRRSEGDNAFGQGSRAPVAVTVLAKNPDAQHDGCRILYRDIGDYLSREDKLGLLREWGSIASVTDWEETAPDRHHDWIGQRDEAFRALYPLGSKTAKAGRTDEAVFRLFSNGYKSGRDSYVYNFDREACAASARRMVDDYRRALRELYDAADANAEKPDIEEIARRHSSYLRWDDKLKQQLRRRTEAAFFEDCIRKIAYRPFVKLHLYADPTFAQRAALTGDIFPTAETGNRAICVPGVGSTKPFSALVVDTMPDLELISKGQCFPRYRYERRDNQQSLPGMGPPSERIDNIADTALRAFRVRYGDSAITKDAIFDYVYGVLHAPSYRERFANDLAKELPRIPFADDFHAFAEAGRRLAALHLGYETCEEYPLRLDYAGKGEPVPAQFRLGQRAMRFADADRTVLIVNDLVRLSGIPPQAHEYRVNGRTPLEWLIDRYRIVRDRQSGIVNDPNGWFDDPRDLIPALRRIVQVSVETVAIIAGLPCPFAELREQSVGEHGCPVYFCGRVAWH